MPPPRRIASLLLALAAVAWTGPGAPRAGAALPLGRSSPPEQRTIRTVAPGLTWTRIVRGRAGARDRWLVNVLTIDRRRLPGRVGAVLSNERVAGLERTSSMARRHGALAAVNGNYFVNSGDPAGALVAGGRLVSEPVLGRTSLLLPASPGQPVSLTTLGYRGSVELGGRRRLLDGVDRTPGLIPNCGGWGGDRPTQRARHVISCTDPSELVAFSPAYASRTPGGPPRVEVVVRAGVVGAIRTGASTRIPADGYVLSGTGDAASFLRIAARSGTRPAVDSQLLRAGTALSSRAYAGVVSAGPRLVSAGRITVRSVPEGFQTPADPGLFANFVAGRNPRTLAGVRPDGRLLLVTVDGRRPGVSIGVSLFEAARLMLALGARDAVNLDGGGSTTMVVRGQVVNRPADPFERLVSVGVLVGY